MTTPPGEQALRALVREVLADLLPAHSGNSGSPEPWRLGPGQWRSAAQAGHGSPVTAQPGPVRSVPAQPGLAHTVSENVESVEMVSLRTDADLAAFVLRLLHLFDNPKHRDALRAGRLKFRLAPASVPGAVQPSHRVDSGAVTEAMVKAAARAGARLVLGPRAVLTPLARDRARSSGVEIDKER